MSKRGAKDNRPLIKSDGAAAVALSANMVVVLYLAYQAWDGPQEWRPWAAVGAVGLTLLTGAVAWGRFSRR